MKPVDFKRMMNLNVERAAKDVIELSRNLGLAVRALHPRTGEIFF